MDISVIICTYNRAHNLNECISCLSSQINTDNIKWEILIVDNNSTDNTKQVVEDLKISCPIPIRYVYEENQGLSYARNRGIQETNSTWIVFIDDDIRVTDKWLSSIYNTFTSHNCDAVGGRIHVQSPELLPAWIKPEMYGFLGHQDFGDKEYPLDGLREFPFGGNMAFHRRVIGKIGLFDTGMGRKGSGDKREDLFKGEETDFFHRLAKTCGSMYYQPDAIVQHIILPYQLKKKFFRTLHYNAGFIYAIKDTNKYDRTFFSIPLFVFPQLIRSISKYLLIVITKGVNTAFRQQMNIGYFLGMVIGYNSKNS